MIQHFMAERHKVNGKLPADLIVAICHTSNMTFAARLRAARKARKPKMSQTDLAKLLGCDQSTVAKWEKEEGDNRSPQDIEATIPRLIEIFGGDDGWWATGKGKAPPGVNLSESFPKDSASIGEYPIDSSDSKSQSSDEGGIVNKLPLLETIELLIKQHGKKKFDVALDAVRKLDEPDTPPSFRSQRRKPTAR